jgi:type IV secretory pathway VirB2 component (pilin)
MRFLEWWSQLSGWVRYPIALAIVTVSVIALGTLPWAFGRLWGLTLAAGFVLLIFGPSTANRRGYHD